MEIAKVYQGWLVLSLLSPVVSCVGMVFLSISPV